MTQALIRGSLTAVAEHNGTSLAESFLSADVIILIDVSGSMAERDATGGRRRWDVACDELARLQEIMPGKIAVISFASEAHFTPGGRPNLPAGGTDLARALKFVAPADGCDIRFIVISDGIASDPEAALAVARSWTSPIDTVHVGPADDTEGRAFLRRLAAAHRGQAVVAEKAHLLAKTLQTLMLASGA